jgi:hypothetical protein
VDRVEVLIACKPPFAGFGVREYKGVTSKIYQSLLDWIIEAEYSRPSSMIGTEAAQYNKWSYDYEK